MNVWNLEPDNILKLKSTKNRNIKNRESEVIRHNNNPADDPDHHDDDESPSKDTCSFLPTSIKKEVTRKGGPTKLIVESLCMRHSRSKYSVG